MGEDAPSAPQTILVVDDDDMHAPVVQGLLEAQGYKVAAAKSGSAALRYFESGTCDLILLDVGMPVMDGFEVCKRLRQNDKTKKIPIVFLSGRTDTQDMIDGAKSGGDTYLTKPYRPAQLINIVKMMLSMRRR